MPRILRPTCWAILALYATSSVNIALASEEGKPRDQDIARGALERGEILPLEVVLSQVRKTVIGEIVGIELERKLGAWVYEIKVISVKDEMIAVYVDARTAKVLETRGK